MSRDFLVGRYAPCVAPVPVLHEISVERTRACLRCGKGCEIAGTSVWWGKGKWHRLNGDTSDHPAVIANMEPADERDD